MNKYSKLFKLVRMELRYTQKDLASRLDVDPGSIYKYENEKMTPGLKVLDKIYKLCEEESLNEPIKLINNYDVKKEEKDMDTRYLIDLQREKIENQQQEINRLNDIVQKSKEVKSKPAFHFKTKCTYDCETKSFGKNEVTGDTSMTGYTEKELSGLTSEEWSSMYHPDSLEILMSSIPDEVPDHTHNIWKHILWKAKDGSYKMYNITSYHDKTEGIVRAYYYWVNGDVEGIS